MRITGFSLQAAHLLAQTAVLQRPSWSPETIHTPEGLFHKNKNAAGYRRATNKSTEIGERIEMST